MKGNIAIILESSPNKQCFCQNNDVYCDATTEILPLACLQIQKGLHVLYEVHSSATHACSTHCPMADGLAYGLTRKVHS